MSIKKRSRSHVISQMNSIRYITIMVEHNEFDKGMVSLSSRMLNLRELKQQGKILRYWPSGFSFQLKKYLSIFKSILHRLYKENVDIFAPYVDTMRLWRRLTEYVDIFAPFGNKNFYGMLLQAYTLVRLTILYYYDYYYYSVIKIDVLSSQSTLL